MAIVVVLQCLCGACERAWPPRRPWELGIGEAYPMAETKGGETYPMADTKGDEARHMPPAQPTGGHWWDTPYGATFAQPEHQRGRPARHPAG